MNDVPVYYTVPAGVDCQIIEDADGPGGRARPRPHRTSRVTTFSEAEVVVHPSGRVGKHTPSSQTVGGRLASEGLAGFSRGRFVLLVPVSSVVESSGEPQSERGRK
jgi:hypothetical protein